jgi:hypothetical protein
MVIFNNIVKNIFNIDGDNTKNDSYSFNLFRIIFSSYIKNKNKSKFVFFNETLKNIFLHSHKNEFISFFCKVQKTYHSLNRFAYICKYKKSKIIVNTDMCLNEISIDDKNVICIFQKNHRYLFAINDIVKIINNSLTSSYLFFVEPKPCKNPYNNLIFEKSTLYNIYFFIKYKTFIYPELVFKFFECNFSLNVFLYKHESLSREYLIKNFVNSSTSSVTIVEIKKMLSIFNNSTIRKITIHDDFPKDKLIQVFKPYLFLHLSSVYSFNNLIKNRASIELKTKLSLFRNTSPHFGRKIVKIVPIQRCFCKPRYKKIFEYVDTHINFNNINNINNTNPINFLQDHIRVSVNSLSDYIINEERPYVAFIVDSHHFLPTYDEENDSDNDNDDADNDDDNENDADDDDNDADDDESNESENDYNEPDIDSVS